MGFRHTAEESARGNGRAAADAFDRRPFAAPVHGPSPPEGARASKRLPPSEKGEGRRLDVEDYAGFFLAFRPRLWAVFLTPCVALKCRASGRGCANRRSHFGHCSLLARRVPFVVTPVGRTPGNGTRR